MSELSPYDQVVSKVKNYLQRKPLLGLVHLPDLYRSAAVDDKERDQAYNFLTRSTIGTGAARYNPCENFYALYLKLNQNLPDNVYLSLPGIPKAIVQLEDPDSPAINDLKTQLRQKYGAARVDFWLHAAEDFTVRIANDAMKQARRRDRGKCILCELEKTLIRKEGLVDNLSKSKRRIASHVISRNSIFWNLVQKIDLDHDLFSSEGTEALQTAIEEDPFICDARHIVMLCSDHDHLLIRTIKDFARELK